MITNITNIVIAAAAVIGLVPLGIRSVRDLIRNRSRKKSSEWVGTIALSVLLSLVAPTVLETAFRHMRAAGEALPDWVKAAMPDEAEPEPEQLNGQPAPSPNGQQAQTPEVQQSSS